MSEWNSSNHFKCVHYEDSSWCKKMKSKIWENDPCPELHPSLSTADHAQLTENLVDSQSDLPPIPKRREGGDCV